MNNAQFRPATPEDLIDFAAMPDGATDEEKTLFFVYNTPDGTLYQPVIFDGMETETLVRVVVKNPLEHPSTGEPLYTAGKKLYLKLDALRLPV